MTNTSGSKRFLSGRLKLLLVAAVVVIGLTAFAVWLLFGFGVFKLHSEVRVFGGALLSPDRLELSTGGPCQGDQEVSMLRETDTDVQVKVVAPSRSFFKGGLDCGGGIVEVQLSEPLGDRVVVDKHTGQRVSVRAFRPTGQQEQARESGADTQSPDQAPQAHGAGDEGTPPPEAPPPEIGDALSDAELEDLQAVADQYGISLQESIDQYGWQNDFSFAVSRIREAAPKSFAGAEIVDGAHAWIAFTGPPPKAALDIIDTFTSSYSSVSVEVRTSRSVTEAELETAIPAVHYAVFKAPGVLNASTSFESATGEIVAVVVLESTASDSVLDDLQAIAEKRLIEVTRPDILDSISISVVRSKSPVLGGND